MYSENIRVNAAWKYLRRAFYEDVKRQADHSGTNWRQMNSEENKVLGFSDLSMPWVVTAYRYHQEILGITNTDILPPVVMTLIRKDMAKRLGMEPGAICHIPFVNFAELLGISCRTDHKG